MPYPSESDLKLDESCISNSKSEIVDWTAGVRPRVQFRISDFEFEMQDSSNFKFPLRQLSLNPEQLYCIRTEYRDLILVSQPSSIQNVID
jgi:hypothetical protein